jgi:hypothetical protein
MAILIAIDPGSARKIRMRRNSVMESVAVAVAATEAMTKTAALTKTVTEA